MGAWGHNMFSPLIGWLVFSQLESNGPIRLFLPAPQLHLVGPGEQEEAPPGMLSHQHVVLLAIHVSSVDGAKDSWSRLVVGEEAEGDSWRDFCHVDFATHIKTRVLPIKEYGSAYI